MNSINFYSIQKLSSAIIIVLILLWQTLASIIYIYLATVTKAITFGGFLSDITEGLQVTSSWR